MLLKLTFNFLLEKQRNIFDSKSIILNIFLTLFLIYLLSLVLFLGYFLDKVIIPLSESSSVTEVFNRGLFYYFFIDLIVRGIAQNQGSFDLKPYLYLPIKKNTLLHFLQVKSFFSFFNLLPFLLFTPFFYKVILQEYSLNEAIVWVGIIVSFTLINNVLSYNFGKTVGKKMVSWLLIMLVLTGIGYFEFKGIFNISECWNMILIWIIKNPIGIVGLLISYVFLYYVTLKFLQKEVYQEKSQAINKEVGFDFGQIFKTESTLGQLIIYESRLILRNKRIRTALSVGVFFIFYPLLLLNQPGYKDGISYLYFFLGLFQTLAIPTMLGQFLFSWEGTFFNFIQTSPFTTKDYLKAKYYVFILLMFVMCIASTAYAFVSWRLVAYMFVGFIFNAGLNLPLLMFMATYNKKAAELDSSAVFNYQGMQVAHFFIMIPPLLFPFFLFIPFTFFFSEVVGMSVMIGLGLIGLLLHKQIIKLIVNQMHYKKYVMLENFNQK